MTTPFHDELLRLSPAERLELIGELWDSIENDRLELSAAQKAELDRRLALEDEGKLASVSWEELEAKLAARCP